MSRKHFEMLARTIACIYGQLEHRPFDKDLLLTLLVNELSDFCRENNARFDYNRFERRVQELVQN